MPQETPSSHDQKAPDAPEQTEDDALRSVLAGLGPGGDIHLYRRSGRGARSGKLAYLTTLSPSAFDLEWVRDEYGGGVYQARPYRSGEGYLPGSAMFEIAGEPRPVEDDDEKDSSEDDEPAWARRITERLDRLESARRDHDSRGIMEALITAAGRQSEAMMSAVSPLLDRIHERDSADLRAMLEIFESGLELGGRAHPETSAVDRLVSDVGLPLVDALTGRGSPAPRGDGDPHSPAPSLVPNPPPGSAPTDQPRPGWVTVLEPEVDQLCALAQVHADVQYWGWAIVDQAPDETLSWVADRVREPRQFAEEFCSWFPRAAPHLDWLVDLFAAISDELEGRGWYEEETDAGPEPDHEDD